MPVLTDKEMFRRLRAGSIDLVYFLYGAESYFAMQAVKEIQKRTVTPGFGGFNLQCFSGDKADIGEIEDACEALPVMAEKKCVCVCDWDLEKLPKESFERLLRMIAAPNESTVLVLYMLSLPVEMKKSARYKKLADAVGKVGAVCEFAQKDKLTLKRALCDRAAKAGAALDVDAAGALIDRCSQDYRILIHELDKLIAYADGREIQPKDVQECCVPSVDASAFDLARSILSGDFDHAYRLLDELFYLRQEAVSILGALSMAFADLYRAKCAVAAKQTVDDVARDFRYPKNRLFAVRNAFRDVLRFPMEQIRSCLDALYAADRKLKSSKADDRLVLEQMLGEMRLAAARR